MAHGLAALPSKLKGRVVVGRVIRSWEELKSNLDKLRLDDGAKIVFTNGCFDILHVGHVRYLQEARAQGSALVVGLNTDQSVRRLKGPNRPVQSEEARAEILAALACVDFVTYFDEETPFELIRATRPNVLVKGGDYTIDKIVGAELVLANGGEVKSLQFVEGFSTTSVIQKMKN